MRRLTPCLIPALAAVCILTGLSTPAGAADRRYCDMYESGEKTILFLIDRTSGGRPEKTKAAIEAARKYVFGTVVPDPARPDRKKVGGAALEAGQGVQISTISDNVANRQIIFSDCRPGRSGGLKRLLDRPLDPVTLAQHDDDFHREASTALSKALGKPESTKKSAIIDTLAKITRERPPGSIAKVVIVSDMLDNLTVNLLPKNGNIRGMTEFQLKEALTTVSLKNAFAHLKGAEVIVFGFGIDDTDRTPLDPDASRMIERFWNAYLQRSEALGEMRVKY
jgi:hypothetical protein